MSLLEKRNPKIIFYEIGILKIKTGGSNLVMIEGSEFDPPACIMVEELINDTINKIT